MSMLTEVYVAMNRDRSIGLSAAVNAGVAIRDPDSRLHSSPILSPVCANPFVLESC